MKRILAFSAALLILLPGCKKDDPAPDASMTVQIASVVEVAQPEKAIEEIYKEVETMGLADADDDVLLDKFNIDPDMLTDYWVRYASGRYGVADVFLLKPKPEKVLTVREALEKVKLSRAKEFENYDIYNAHQIALDAQVFEQGGFVILLMLEDAEGARTIIDQYIPKL